MALIKRLFTILTVVIPCTPPLFAWTCFILNAIVPGLGTMISSFWFLRWEYPLIVHEGVLPKRKRISFMDWLWRCGAGVTIGLMQLFSAVIVLGWVWSVAWAVLLVNKS
eukprot:Ihof_evm5s221 gene=Ihof_evmTU5s221